MLSHPRDWFCWKLYFSATKIKKFHLEKLKFKVKAKLGTRIKYKSLIHKDIGNGSW